MPPARAFSTSLGSSWLEQVDRPSGLFFSPVPRPIDMAGTALTVSSASARALSLSTAAAMVKHPAAPVQHKHYRPAGKKKEGNAARYVTRSQAVKQLQVSLPLFRKLCILKGVFPREPKKKVKGNHHTYYHLKDVSFIQHEPLLEQLREIRAYERNVKKADAKKNKGRAALLKERSTN